MQGKVDDQAKELVWKAYQTYQDGSLVEWVGAADADKPASVTKVNPAVAGSTERATVQHIQKRQWKMNNRYSLFQRKLLAVLMPLYMLLLQP